MRLTGRSLRVVPAAVTVAAVRPLLGAHGVSRVADVTGLDVLGIPVFVVTRPQSRTLSIAMGKGLDRDSALASGLMEAIEIDIAEARRVPVLTASYAEVAGAGHTAVDPRAFHPLVGRAVDATTTIGWAAAYDLRGGDTVLVPVERVGVDAVQPDDPALAILAQDSNGLASGNVVTEAVVHGILELIERDSRAAEVVRITAGHEPRRLDPQTLGGAVAELARRCRAARLRLELLDQTGAIGIPAIEARLHDGGATRLPTLPTMSGNGCHPDAPAAAVRAITEAAQSRLCVITGAREDLETAHYERAVDPPAPTGWSPSPASLAPSPGGLDDLLALLLGRLESAGAGLVVAVDLSPPGEPVAVVRIIAPALAPYRGTRRGRVPLSLGTGPAGLAGAVGGAVGIASIAPPR